MTPDKALEPVERAALNIEAAHKWLSDGQAPRRTEVERCLCINKALAHLEIARAALEAAQPLPDIEKVAERIERLLPAIEADGHLTCSRLVRRLIEDIEKVAKQ